MLGILSGVISTIGSILIIKALSAPSSSVPHVMALVNTNVFFALIFSVLILNEVPKSEHLSNLIIGGVFILAGGYFISKT